MPRLTPLATAILAEELNRAFFRCGRRLMTIYLNDLADSRALEITQSPQLLRQAIDDLLLDREREARASGQPEPLAFLAQTRNYPRQKTLDRLKLVDEEVRRGPLEGTHVSAIAKLLHLSPDSVGSLLRRNNDHHKLVIARDHIRLRSDVLVDIIGKRHAANISSAVRSRPTRRDTRIPIKLSVPRMPPTPQLDPPLEDEPGPPQLPRVITKATSLRGEATKLVNKARRASRKG